MAHTVRLVLACILGSLPSLAQEADRAAPASPAVARETTITPKQFVTNILHDQKAIWTFPGKVVRGKHWKPVAAVALGTLGFVLLDPYTEAYFHDRSGFSTYRTGPLRGRNTTLVFTLTPVAFYVAGLVRHSPHSRNTALLAAEALVDTQVVSFVIKNATGRSTPSDIPPHGNLRDTWFKYQGSFTNRGGFPSGHTASAFAVATVIAARYRQHRWVPYAAYGAATLLALTRLPDRAHFPSDLFMGGAVGYGISRFIVLNR